MEDLVIQALLVALLSVIGGCATFLQRKLELGKKVNYGHFLLDILTALLAGFGAFFLCLEGKAGIWLTLFCVSVSGFNGAEVLWTFKKKFHSVLGTGGVKK
ncbi:phage holin family protein [Pseudoalteromonas sp. C2R02]|uniref:phage holin family protein n=1 Tax=Pseudoalteromonas sp. C2R02 TaxID=2841565 RepID=UPI001C099C9E|nr:phage holin family protein [Pseudoalteromonas sp. C2R02]